MWALRILSGPQAGQVIQLKNGKNKFGRAPSCDFQIEGQGISKEHFEITVMSGKMMLTDLKSSNGTFVNGLRVQNSLVRAGDRLMAHQLLFELVFAVDQAPVRQSHSHSLAQAPRPMPSSLHMPVPMPMQHLPDQHVAGQAQATMAQAQPPKLFERIQSYIDRVVLPSIYQLTKVFEYKFVVYGFGAVFVLLITLLSVIPMKTITAESVQTESRRRAVTVARALAQSNERVLRSGDYSSFSTDLMLREEGIDDVYIVSKDGTILAPGERAGSTPQDAGFVKKILGQTQEVSGEVGLGKVGAAVPILTFDPEIQQNVARAYAVVIYNPGGLTFDDGRAFSLLVQMLILAMGIGFVVFFLLNKLIEHPLRLLNQQIDTALRDGKDHADIDMSYPVLQEVLVNLNSLLARVGQGGGQSGGGISNVQREAEILNLVQLVGYPCLLISKDQVIRAVNTAFENVTGVSQMQIQGQALQFLPDQAMQKNIQSLMELAAGQNQIIHKDSLEVSGNAFDIQCQSLSLEKDSELFLITLTPQLAIEGGAA